jgi:hypothetical protein
MPIIRPDRHRLLEIGQKDGMREHECGRKQEQTPRSPGVGTDRVLIECSRTPSIGRDSAGERDDTYLPLIPPASTL